jgi:hypothetical protein
VVYTVSVVSTTATQVTRQINVMRCDSAQMRPATVSLGRDGTIGIILPDDPLFLTGARYLTVRHHNGQFENIPAPAPQLLAHSFRRFEAIGGSPKFQDVYFRTVEIASDGTAFATIASHFWGGYSGVETSTFRWRSQRWGVTTSLDVMPPQIPGWQVNTQIGGVDGDLSIALNGVYGDKVLPDNAYIDDPTYQLNRVELLQQQLVRDLGVGTATAVRGNVVVGFRGGLNAFRVSCAKNSPTTAIEWARGAVRNLGPGVAYDVDAHDRVVGDDEASLGAEGRPTLWAGSRAVQLDKRGGSAFAIGDDGTVVGEVSGKGFVSDANHPERGVTLLDSMLRDRSWAVTAAYGVDKYGSILAYASRPGGRTQVVLLTKHRT